MADPLILGIETSCDETAAAVAAGRRLLSSVVASQVEIHARYGGVVPEVASRQHLLAILPVIDRALAGAGVGAGELAAIAVTYGPGLAGSLLVGVNAAKGLALARGLPLIGVNHLEAHIYANFIEHSSSQAVEQSSSRAVEQSSSQAVEQSSSRQSAAGSRGGELNNSMNSTNSTNSMNCSGGAEGGPASYLPSPTSEFPLLCLIVSGGHTDLVLMEKHLDYRLVGRTRDDAAGEAFDKAARLLGLGYPGGPAVQESAPKGDARRLKLPRAWLRGTDDFSFSGLKTALWQVVHRGALSSTPGDGRPGTYDAAASFQEAVVEVLVTKTVAAARNYGVRTLLVAGGVAANRRLRQRFEEECPVPLRIPPLSLCTDNAAMVAACGYYRWQAGRLSGYDLDAVPGLGLGSG